VIELLDCPFCGCEPDFLLDEDNCPYVTCHSCQFSMPAYRPGFEHMAIAAWNRRAAPAAGTEKDAERLDFMITEECQIEHIARLGAAPYYRVRWPWEGKQMRDWSATPREAIDAAIAAKEPPCSS
jgi:Lar family restriction alleviation protein